MAVTYRILGHNLVMTCKGVYTHPQVVAVFMDATKDPAFNPPMSLLVDARQSKANPSLDQIESLVNFLSSFRTALSPRGAILAVPNSLIYGLGRMYAALAAVKGFEIEIFERQRDALVWLAQPDDPAQSKPPCRCA